MAFIKNKERESLIKKINKSYTFRKVIISIEILLLLIFIAITFVSFYFSNKNDSNWYWFKDDNFNQLTGLGWGMLVYCIVILLLGIIALLLTFTLKSPKDTQAKMVKLEKSPLSGKKNEDASSNFESVRNRSRSQKPKK